MARYKDYNLDQDKMIPLSFRKQILPGTFEYSLNWLIDNEIDMSVFEARYINDDMGAPAYDPAILLKIVLYAYSRGIISSRQIERACWENIIFMALSADTRPHFTTIADFISSLEQEIVYAFLDVLWVCDELGLIGKEMFALDGCKMPSNASKEWSGTFDELNHKREKLEEKLKQLLDKHQILDQQETAIDSKKEQAKLIVEPIGPNLSPLQYNASKPIHISKSWSSG